MWPAQPITVARMGAGDFVVVVMWSTQSSRALWLRGSGHCLADRAFVLPAFLCGCFFRVACFWTLPVDGRSWFAIRLLRRRRWSCRSVRGLKAESPSFTCNPISSTLSVNIWLKVEHTSSVIRVCSLSTKIFESP